MATPANRVSYVRSGGNSRLSMASAARPAWGERDGTTVTFLSDNAAARSAAAFAHTENRRLADRAAAGMEFLVFVSESLSPLLEFYKALLQR